MSFVGLEAYVSSLISIVLSNVTVVDDVLDFKSPCGVHHFFQTHVCSNFNNQFKNVHLKDLCWHVGTQHQTRNFRRHNGSK